MSEFSAVLAVNVTVNAAVSRELTLFPGSSTIQSSDSGRL